MPKTIDRHLDNLPPSQDEFWEGANTKTNRPVKLNLCEIHKKSTWMLFDNYNYEPKTNSIVCPKCGWGTRLAGYYKFYNGRVYDLRGFSREQEKH